MKKTGFMRCIINCTMIIPISIVLLSAAGSGESAARKIEKSLFAGGIEAARKLMAEMRQAPEGTYSFVENEFRDLLDRLEKNKKTTETFELLKLCEPLFPDSQRILYRLALAYQAQGDQQSFYRYVRKTHRARLKVFLARFIKQRQGKLLNTAEGVINKHLESTGGIQAWRDINTLKIQLYNHSTAGRGEVLERYYKRPSFFRQGFQGTGSFIATDGKTVWQVNKGIWKEIPGEPYKRSRSLDDFFIDYQKQGVSYKFMGVEILNYAPVYHLKRTFWDKYQEDLYFSIQAGYLTEKFTPYNLGPSYFTLWDYRKVGDILIPHVRMRLVGDFGPPHGAIIKKVEINIPLDDSLFIKKDP